jgi:hypothetical protein
VCGSSARTDLYGGQLAIAVPTVTEVTTIGNAAHLQRLERMGSIKDKRLTDALAVEHDLILFDKRASSVQVAQSHRPWAQWPTTFKPL